MNPTLFQMPQDVFQTTEVHRKSLSKLTFKRLIKNIKNKLSKTVYYS